MTHHYELSSLKHIYYHIVSVKCGHSRGGFSARSHGAESKVSGLLRVSGASSKPTGCWRNSFSLVAGLRSLFSDYWLASGNTCFYSTSTPRGHSQLLSGLSYRPSHNIIAGSKILQMELHADLILSDLGKN